MKVKLLFEFSDIEQRVPKRREIYKGIYIGSFWTSVKSGLHKELLPLLLQNSILLSAYNKYMGYKDERISDERYVKLFLEYLQAHKKFPDKDEIYNNINIGKIWASIRKGFRKNLLPILLENNTFKNNYEKYLEEQAQQTTTENRIDIFIEYVQEHSRVPVKLEVYKGVGVAKIFEHFKMGRYSEEIREKLLNEPLIREAYEIYLQSKETRITPNQRMELLLEFVRTYKRLPKYTERYKGVLIREFWNNVVKNGYHKSLLSVLLEEPILRSDYEKYNNVSV